MGTSFPVAPALRKGLQALALVLFLGAMACAMGAHRWENVVETQYLLLWVGSAVFGLSALVVLSMALARVNLREEGLELRDAFFITRQLKLAEARGYTYEAVFAPVRREYITFYGKNGGKLFTLGLNFESPEAIRAWVVEHLVDLGPHGPRSEEKVWPKEAQEELSRVNVGISVPKFVLLVAATPLLLGMTAISLLALFSKELGLPEKGGAVAMALLFGWITWLSISQCFARLLLTPDEICVAYPSGRRDSTLLTLISGYQWVAVEYHGAPVGQQLVLFGHDGKELRRIPMNYRDFPRIRDWVSRHLTRFDARRLSR